MSQRPGKQRDRAVESPAEPEHDGSELPEGWASVGLMDVFDIQGGTQPPKKEFVYEATEGYVRLLQIRDFGEKPVPTFIRMKSTLKTCSEADILIGRYGASVGRICTGMAGAYNVALTKVVIPDGLDRRFVFYLLKSEIFQRPILDIERSAQDGFNKDDLAEIRVPIAPLAEQRRIVAKLEELLGKVSSSQQRLSRVPGLLKRFRQSVLAAACSGRLTADWRDQNEDVEPVTELIDRILIARRQRVDELNRRLASEGRKPPKKPANLSRQPIDADSQPEIPGSWEWVTWNDLADWITYGFTRPMPHVADGIPVVTAKTVRDGYFDYTDIDRTTPEAFAELNE